MQSLPERCVAPQLQPTGLYRQNQILKQFACHENIQYDEL